MSRTNLVKSQGKIRTARLLLAAVEKDSPEIATEARAAIDAAQVAEDRSAQLLRERILR